MTWRIGLMDKLLQVTGWPQKGKCPALTSLSAECWWLWISALCRMSVRRTWLRQQQRPYFSSPFLSLSFLPSTLPSFPFPLLSSPLLSSPLWSSSATTDGLTTSRTASPAPAAPLMYYSLGGSPLNTGAYMGVLGGCWTYVCVCCVCVCIVWCGMLIEKLVPFLLVLPLPYHHHHHRRHYYQKQHQLNAKQTCLLNNWGSQAGAASD